MANHLLQSLLFWLSRLRVLPGHRALAQTKNEVVFREPGQRFLGSPKPVQPRAALDLQFAWLAAAAYGNAPVGLKEKARIEEHARGIRQGGSVPNDRVAAVLASPVPQDALKAAGWEPWPGFPGPDLVQKFKATHLRVEIWICRRLPAVGVAFGGTVFNNEADWRANLRWFIPKWLAAGWPDEYSQTVELLGPRFLEEFKARVSSGDPAWRFLERSTIYSTGHSLGGGLAQQFAYALPKDDIVNPVSKVFAFDPSPVTGFFSVPKALRDSNRKTLKIDRIYERGEILAILRSLTSLLRQPSGVSPVIRGVRYSLFYPANPIAGHSMNELAAKLNIASGGQISKLEP